MLIYLQDKEADIIKRLLFGIVGIEIMIFQVSTVNRHISSYQNTRNLSARCNPFSIIWILLNCKLSFEVLKIRKVGIGKSWVEKTMISFTAPSGWDLPISRIALLNSLSSVERS